MTWNQLLGPGAALALLLALPVATQAAGPGAGDPAAPHAVYPEPPAAGDRSLTRFGLEFQPTNPNFRFLPAPAPSIRCDFDSPFSYVDAWFSLPDGAQLRYVDIFGHDSSATEDMHFVLFRTCQLEITGPPGTSTTFLLGQVGSSGASGDFLRVIDLSAGNEVLNGYGCKYLVRARFAAQGNACPSALMAIDKVRFRYRRLP